MRSSLWIATVVGVFACGTATVLAQSQPHYDIRVNSAGHFDQKLHDSLVRQRAAADGSLDTKQLAAFRDLMLQGGWPTVTAAGRDGVDAAGDLARFATADYPLQVALKQIIGNRISVDIDGLAFARLDDDIEAAHGGHQPFGTLLKLDGGRVVPWPPTPELEANRARDFTGLPLLQDYLKAVQARVDAGQSLDSANAIPRLSAPARELSNLPLRKQLSDMAAADQAARSDYFKAAMKPDSPSWKKIQDVDRHNLEALKAIFAKYGFPTVAMVGRSGVTATFLLAQHADADREFQKHALELAKSLLERGELPRSLYAMLVDRVRLADGKPQLYGTQVKAMDGKVEMLPVEDPGNLDVRRRSMALEPEAEYRGEFHMPTSH
ncbi:DUF6624 domain-containing protein [Luteibacter sp. NPDC031894]|uniref:DUF6624 domain-containing protein n=1 Tax=Luteibacter sp. NPDC031894 TaxID=3390572 RepID=UPI003CFE1CC1